MKVLFLTRRFFPDIGGVEKHTLEVARQLIKKSHLVTVVCEMPSKNDVMVQKKDEHKGITIIRIPISFKESLKKFQIWFWFLKNISIIYQSRIIHCHDVFFWMLPFRFIFPFKKIYTTFHGWEGIFPPTKNAKMIRKISEKLSNGNICVGKYLEKWYGTKADFITYGGVNFVKSLPAGKAGTKLRILFVGRLEPDTGLPVHLKTLRFLREMKVDFEIKFCAGGSLRKEAEKFGRVLGFKENVLPYINWSDIVFPTGYLTILESMSQKKLVFSTYKNSLREDYLRLTPFADYMFIENDPKRLAEKIRYCQTHPAEKEKLTNEAFAWAKTQTWEKVCKMYLQLWKINKG